MWLTTDELNMVPALEPMFYDNVVGTTAFPCAVVKLGKYDSMVAIISLRANSAIRMWVDEYNSLTPTGAGTLGTTGNYFPIAASYRYSGSTGGTAADTLSARTALTSSGVLLAVATSTTSKNYYIEIKSADLDAGFPYVAIAISTSATASTGIAVNYVMKPRYLQLDMSTAVS